MSQRTLSSIEQRGGGIKPAKTMARALGIHLVRLTDDQGDVLVAASPRRFNVIA